MSLFQIGTGKLPDPEEIPANRLSSNFISTYQKYTKDLEVTSRINTAVCFTTLAAALERKVYLPEAYSQIYPNLYTVIVGPAGITRKTTACQMGVNLLRKIKSIHKLPSRMTEASLIEVIGRSYRKYKRGGTDEQQSAVFGYSNELSTIIKDANGIVSEILTELYECGGDDSSIPWVKETKGDGATSLHGACINLLSACPPGTLTDLIPAKQMETGFASRISFIYEPRPPEIIQLASSPSLEHLELGKILLHDLKHIHGLNGVFTRTPEAIAYYNDWYVKDRKLSLQHRGNKFSGYFGRKPVLVHKYSMLLSVAVRSDLIIDIEHVQGAIEWLNSEQPYMLELLGFAGRNDKADLTIKVMDYIRLRGSLKPVTQAELLRHFLADLNHIELQECLDGLKAMNQISHVICGSASGFQPKPEAKDLRAALTAQTFHEGSDE